MQVYLKLPHETALAWLMLNNKVLPQKGDRIEHKRVWYTVDYIAWKSNGDAVVVVKTPPSPEPIRAEDYIKTNYDKDE